MRGVIIEYRFYDGVDVHNVPGKEWRWVRREIVRLQAEVDAGTSRNDVGIIERVERHWEDHGGFQETTGDEYEELWVHPDYDADEGEWKE